MANYAAIRDRVLGSVDRVMAEKVELFFHKNGAVDPARDKTEATAVLRTGHSAANNMTGGKNRQWKSKVAATGGTLGINRSVYTGPLPVKGDRIRAVERLGKPFFEVLFVDDRSHTRLVLILGDA